MGSFSFLLSTVSVSQDKEGSEVGLVQVSVVVGVVTRISPIWAVLVEVSQVCSEVGGLVASSVRHLLGVDSDILSKSETIILHSIT